MAINLLKQNSPKRIIAYIGVILIISLLLLRWEQIRKNNDLRSQADLVFTQISTGQKREEVFTFIEKAHYCDHYNSDGKDYVTDYYVYGDPKIDTTVLKVDYSKTNNTFLVESIVSVNNQLLTDDFFSLKSPCIDSVIN